MGHTPQLAVAQCSLSRGSGVRRAALDAALRDDGIPLMHNVSWTGWHPRQDLPRRVSSLRQRWRSVRPRGKTAASSQAAATSSGLPGSMALAKWLRHQADTQPDRRTALPVCHSRALRTCGSGLASPTAKASLRQTQGPTARLHARRAPLSLRQSRRRQAARASRSRAQVAGVTLPGCNKELSAGLWPVMNCRQSSRYGRWEGRGGRGAGGGGGRGRPLQAHYRSASASPARQCLKNRGGQFCRPVPQSGTDETHPTSLPPSAGSPLALARLWTKPPANEGPHGG